MSLYSLFWLSSNSSSPVCIVVFHVDEFLIFYRHMRWANDLISYFSTDQDITVVERGTYLCIQIDFKENRGYKMHHLLSKSPGRAHAMCLQTFPSYITPSKYLWTGPLSKRSSLWTRSIFVPLCFHSTTGTFLFGEPDRELNSWTEMSLRSS